MLTVLLNWTYILITTYIIGNACLRLLHGMFGRCEENKWESPFYALFAGIMCTTCYAQIYSLFAGVGLAANLILAGFCVSYTVFFGKKMLAELSVWRTAFWNTGSGGERCAALQGLHNVLSIPEKENGEVQERSGGRRRLLFGSILLLSLIVYALASSGAPKLIDTDWYHAQTIRWIEEYGCVTGVANLFYSLGFNSAQHYFDALYSMRELLGQSMHATGGYFGWLIFLHGLFRLFGFFRHKRHIADALALAEIVYSIIVTAFFADPYTDTLPNCLVFFILTEWLGLLEEEEEEVFPYAFLCIFGVYATVVKTSAVMIIFLVIRPAIRLIRDKEWKKIFSYLLLGIAVAVPFFITNVKTSGYLVYLAAFADFFDVPWKIDAEVLKYSVDSMVHAARAIDMPMEEALHGGLSWVRVWFRNDSISHQLLYLAVFSMLLFDLAGVLCGLFKRKKPEWSMLLVRVIVLIGLIYWFFTIPQVKYCWVFLLFPLVVIPAVYLEKGSKICKIPAVLLAAGAGAVLLVYAGFYGFRTLGYVKAAVPAYLIRQADYAKYEMVPVQKDGLTFYVREEGGAVTCGYYVFPYLNDEELLDQLVVGEGLQDGFLLESTKNFKR